MTFNPRDKEVNMSIYRDLFLNKLQSMFVYEGIENTAIAQHKMNRFFFNEGYACIFEHQDKLHCVRASLSGDQNEHFEFHKFRVDNPALNINREFEDGVDGIIIWNDSQHSGLKRLIDKYAFLLSENELSIYAQMILSRANYLITAKDDKTKKAADEFFKQLEKWNPTVVLESQFLEGLNVSPLNNTNNFTYSIELHSYLQAMFFNEIGLNANKDQKREALASEEVSVNSQILFPQVDDMLFNRQKGFKRVEDLWGVKITPTLGSSWLVNHDDNNDNINDTEEEVKEDENQAIDDNE